jgi:hypothetical protein
MIEKKNLYDNLLTQHQETTNHFNFNQTNLKNIKPHIFCSREFK